MSMRLRLIACCVWLVHVQCALRTATYREYWDWSSWACQSFHEKCLSAAAAFATVVAAYFQRKSMSSELHFTGFTKFTMLNAFLTILCQFEPHQTWEVVCKEELPIIFLY